MKTQQSRISITFIGLLMALLSMLLFVNPAQAFHFPWDQAHDTTDYNDPDNPGPYLPTGHFIWRDKDIEIFGRQKLMLVRTYNSNDPRDGLFGNGWTSGCEESLFITKTIESDAQGNLVTVTKYILRLSDGKRYTFIQEGDGPIQTPEGRYEVLALLSNGTIQLTEPGATVKVYLSTGDILSRADRNGASLEYTYSAGRIDRITDQHNRYLEFSFNTGGRVESVTDFEGRIWSYSYDTDGNLTSVTNPLGNVRRYEYQSYQSLGDSHTYYQLTRIVDESGVELTNVVYNNDKVVRYSELEDVFTVTYSAQNKTVTKTNSLGSNYTFTYDEDQQIVNEVDPLGSNITSQYDDKGNLTRTVDQEGQAWTATYDDIGRVLTETDPLGNSVTWEYLDRFLWPIKMTSPSGRITEMKRDGQGNLIVYKDPSGAQITNTWSSDGLLLETQDAQGNKVSYENDALGRKKSTTDALNRTINTDYDNLSRVTREIDAKGNSKQYTYDALGRVTQSADRTGQTMNYSYDGAGRLLSVTDARNNVYAYAYDSFGRLATKTSPDGAVTTYNYYTDNQLAQVVHPDNIAISFVYDKNKQLIQKNIGTDTYNFAYNKKGDLISATNSSGTVTRNLDDTGQIVQETLNGVSLDFTYSVNGERTKIAGLGGTTDYVRDARGLITSVVDTTGTYIINYDVNGLRQSMAYPNGVQANYTRDADQQILSITHQGFFSDVRNYVYDPVGNIRSQAINGANRSYTYDQREQLTNANYPGKTFDFNYDAAGNIENNSRDYNETNELTESNTYLFEYNARGNLIRKTEKASGAKVEYQWNALNELLLVERYLDGAATAPFNTTSYLYGPLGRRIAKIENGVEQRYVYDGFNRIGTLDQAGLVINRVVFGVEIDEPLGMTTPQGNKYFFSDSLGSIIAIADASSVLDTFSYSPYGSLLTGEINATPFGFTGREMDAPDLYFYRTRYYDPTTQRFLTSDPIGFSGGANLFAYVDGNPINNADPLGLQRGSSAWCRRQLERIRNIENKIKERISELKEDPMTLPDVCPGDDRLPSLSRRGHRRLINMDKANLAAQRALYQAYCSNNPPPPPIPVPAPETSPNTNPSSGVDWNTVGTVTLGIVVVVGIGAAIYFSGGLAAPAFASSRKQKRHINEVDAEALLEKTAQLKISSWQYRRERGITHIGPMSEDFHGAFGLGASNKKIALVDANGVLYASVKALYDRVDTQNQEIKLLKEQIRQQNEKMEHILALLQENDTD